MRDRHEIVLVVLAKDAVLDVAAIIESQLRASGRTDAQQLRAAAAAAPSKQQEVRGGVHDAGAALLVELFVTYRSNVLCSVRATHATNKRSCVSCRYVLVPLGIAKSARGAWWCT